MSRPMRPIIAITDKVGNDGLEVVSPTANSLSNLIAHIYVFYLPEQKQASISMSSHGLIFYTA